MPRSPSPRLLTAQDAGRLVLVLLALIGLTLSPARAAEPAPGVLDRAMAAVLTVRTADDADRFLGTAFLWGAEGALAVTNAHVVGKAAEVRLTDAQGQEQTGRVLAVDQTRDVAVIAVTPAGPGLVAGPPARLGQEVWALGAPLGLDLSVTAGIVSATARQADPTAPLRMVQHDAAVNPGSSGGPLVDAEGRLLGMNSRIADGSRTFVGIAYAIPAPDLDRIVPALLAGHLLPLPHLGLRARAVDRTIASALGLPPVGLLVDEVEPGSLTATAGLLPGDILLAVNGVPLSGPGDLPFAVEAAQTGGPAALTVHRAGAELALSMDLTAPAPTVAPHDPAQAVRIDRYSLAELGLTFDDQLRITALTRNSPAALAGIAEGERLLALNGQALDPAALDQVAITAASLFLVEGPGGMTRHVVVDPWGRADGLRPVGGANVLDPAVVVF